MDSTIKKLLIGLIISILILAGSIFYRLNCADEELTNLPSTFSLSSHLF